MAIPKQASQLLQQLREKHGWTMAELAEKSGVSATTIANYERGERADGAAFEPTPRMLMKIGAAFPTAEGRAVLDAFGFEGAGPAATAAERAIAGDVVTDEAPARYGAELKPGDALEVLGWLGDEGDVLLARDPQGRLRLWVEKTDVVARNAKDA